MDKPGILNQQFRKELKDLLNKHSIENECGMPDFLLAEMIINHVYAVRETIKKNQDWHGCDFICHPKKQSIQTKETDGYSVSDPQDV